METLSAIYLFCLVFGGGFFLATSLFLGEGHEGDDGDIGGLGQGLIEFLESLGVDFPDSDDGVQAANPLNLKNILAFLTIFGLVGTVTTLFMKVSLLLSLLLSIPSGILAAIFSWLIVLFAVSRQATSQARRNDFIHQVGEVSVAIPENGLGEITVVIKGQLKGLLARSYMGGAVKKGEEVTIVRYEADDVVAVVPLSIIKE